ncbi:monovalent cation/H+ antiporter complex subunit F [Phreatobacter oligotrophus]|jgi:multisubunit Na+/H+ antiporter MnhF subunit|uniref:Multicomponent K+:H+ antiporter subunit F/multicomponent Na+:H+ antiporter subunit F n=1 Tax=Phreatobacter oligotrophus TaxID=1122261 RepID=A0A2T4YWS7_9HYPH|nr:monovalent cation/H+ antiporter complex subunit F [Phreatobacter oligotrophus]PTM49306.1 multicomponent K+:H+ antiporter subunit F/multicomponent Na+:H+ antiporter subunit F [Phreatobacter oligotrophus]
MTAATIQAIGIYVSASLLLVAVLAAAMRIVRGPGGPDRVVALDLLSLLGVAAAAMAVVISGSTAFMDIALGVALVGFLTTVAFAAFIERGSINEEEER